MISIKLILLSFVFINNNSNNHNNAGNNSNKQTTDSIETKCAVAGQVCRLSCLQQEAPDATALLLFVSRQSQTEVQSTLHHNNVVVVNAASQNK